MLNSFLELSAEALPEKEALVCQGKRFTFAEIENAANAFCNALLEEGLRRQDRVIIYLENSTELVISIFAILKSGGIFVIINPKTKPRKLEYLLLDCEAETLITDCDHYMLFAEAVPKGRTRL